MIKSYYIKKDTINNSYPDISVIDTYFIKFSDFGEEFISVKIDDSVKLQRKLKLLKLNNNTVLSDFIQFIINNNISLTNVIISIIGSQQENNKYNNKNYDTYIMDHINLIKQKNTPY